MLSINDSIPSFSLPDENGVIYSTDSLKGKKYILYFYPKDDTPGCTIEACNFRDHVSEYEKKGIPIFGIGKGNARDHKKFKEKYDLPFTLLVDTDLNVCRAFGVLKEKSMFGKKYDGIARTTFFIDEEGKIAHIWEQVNPTGHAEEILKDL